MKFAAKEAEKVAAEAQVAQVAVATKATEGAAARANTDKVELEEE